MTTKIACFHSWISTCVIVGTASNKILTIEEAETNRFLEFDEVVGWINCWKKKYPIYDVPSINKNRQLKTSLRGGIIVDFEEQDKSELDGINDLYQSLKKSKKLILSEKVNRINFDKGTPRKCLNILLNSLTLNLCGNYDYIPGALASVRKVESRFRKGKRYF